MTHHPWQTCKSNSSLLLSSCADLNLALTHYFNSETCTGSHGTTRTLNIGTSLFIVCSGHRKHIHITHTIPSADDYWTDHRLIILNDF